MRARTYIAALGIAFVCSVLVGEAAVTRIEVLKVEPVSAAASAGVIPPYERISGRFYGELDPKDPKNHDGSAGSGAGQITEPPKPLKAAPLFLERD